MKKTLKNIVLIVITIMICSGCHRTDTENKIAQNKLNNCNVVIRDSCEYLCYDSYGGIEEYIHKGDCKNCRAWYERTINNAINNNTK